MPLKILDTDVKMENVRETFGKLHSMKVGETVNILVQRGDEEVEVSVTLQQRMDKNIFESMETTDRAAEAIKRGMVKKYLILILNCTGCHSLSRLAGVVLTNEDVTVVP